VKERKYHGKTTNPNGENHKKPNEDEQKSKEGRKKKVTGPIGGNFFCYRGKETRGEDIDRDERKKQMVLTRMSGEIKVKFLCTFQGGRNGQSKRLLLPTPKYRQSP